MRVSTIPAPGLSSKLIPRLLTDLTYLTVLDVGSYMPPRIEIPELVDMSDPAVQAAYAEAEAITNRVMAEQAALRQEREQLLRLLEVDESVRPALLAWTARAAEAEARHTQELAWAKERTAWGEEHDLEGTYREIVGTLERLSQERNQTARMGKGTIPRWFAALPCDLPFTLEQTQRGTWGEELDKILLLATRRLPWEYLYPAEKRLREIVLKELDEKRRVMVYIEQNELRSMSKRLAWVFQDIPTWTLPNSVKSEDRQQAILDAVHTKGITLLFVPYRKVNEGLNLQTAIDTVVWYELAMNLFLLDQASRRAWRLGKQEEVRIYYVVYAGTSGHSKLRKLGNQSGAAAAFAGEPARGALIEHAGADKSTLARLAASVDAQQQLDEEEEEEDLFTLRYSEEEAQSLKDAFAHRAAEEREALRKGRQWVGGIVDTLPQRLPAFFAETARSSVWALQPQPRRVCLSDVVRVEPMREAVQFVGAFPPMEAPPSAISVDTATCESPMNTLPPPPPRSQGQETLPPRKTTLQPSARLSKTTRSQANNVPVATGTGDTANTLSEPLITPPLIFGNKEHIALARGPKRLRKSARLKRPKRLSPVEVCTIAAVDTTMKHGVEPQALPLSLWESREGEHSATGIGAQPVKQAHHKEVFSQQQLWERPY